MFLKQVQCLCMVIPCYCCSTRVLYFQLSYSLYNPQSIRYASRCLYRCISLLRDAYACLMLVIVIVALISNQRHLMGVYSLAACITSVCLITSYYAAILIDAAIIPSVRHIVVRHFMLSVRLMHNLWLYKDIRCCLIKVQLL